MMIKIKAVPDQSVNSINLDIVKLLDGCLYLLFISSQSNDEDQSVGFLLILNRQMKWNEEELSKIEYTYKKNSSMVEQKNT